MRRFSEKYQQDGMLLKSFRFCNEKTSGKVEINIEEVAAAAVEARRWWSAKYPLELLLSAIEVLNGSRIQWVASGDDSECYCARRV